jgi:glycosyltransferase involved in cell wall biosynthesis
MKVLIDCTQIARKKAGVGVYAFNMIRELIRVCPSPDWHLYLLVQDDDSDLLGKQHANVTVIPVRSKLFRILPLRFLLEQIYIPYLSHKLGVDVVHSLHYSFPLFPMRAKKVVSIHDMTVFLMPEMHVLIKKYYFRFFIRASARRNDDISLIFVSRSALDDYRELFPYAKTNNHVVLLGRSTKFHPELDPEQVARAQHRYGIVAPYLLFVGTIEPRKNLVRLVQAFSDLSVVSPESTLIIAGMKGWQYEDLFALVKQRGLEEKVRFLGFIDEAEKPFLIKGAQVFVYPSLYEGFGIPVLEALSCGTPTLTSNISAMPEVAGDAAVLVDPKNLDDIRRGLQLLMTDASLRATLAQRSVKRAGMFDWRKTASQTRDVYLVCLANGTSKRAKVSTSVS